MAKIFLSHSVKNKELVENFIEFLQLALGISRGDIFCTIAVEDLYTGENFMERIRKELQDSTAVISLITEEYLQSKMCLIEMGAGWSMAGKRFIPITTLPFERLKDMPLAGVQIRKMDQDGLSAVFGEFIGYGICDAQNVTEFTRHLPKYMAKFQRLTVGNVILKKDAEGWYHTVITEIRHVQDKYRCYKIKGQIDQPLDNGQADSEWIFFWAGMYDDLQVGDHVKFQISKTEVRTFNDIGRARNIYPSSLVKI